MIISGPLSGPTSIKLTTIRKDGDESALPDDDEEVADWISSSDSTADDSINLSVVWKVCTIMMMTMTNTHHVCVFRLARFLLHLCCVLGWSSNPNLVF